MKTSSINLSSVTTYRFGGLCKNFITIDNVKNFSEISEDINSNNTFVLGKGSNIAFTDSEYTGYVLQTDFNFINLFSDENTLEVGSSVYLPELSRYLKKQSLGGGEFLLGIPGSVGGALKMNAGAYGYEIGTNVVEVNCYDLDQKRIVKLDSKSINYSYRKSSNLNNKVILSAILKFEKGNPKEISEKMSEFNKNRKKSQPPGIYNAGSVFKNTKEYFAGELIEKTGLKGYSINDVSVSTKHANFFIAKKGAKSSSLYKLVQHVKEKVNDKYGIMLEEEIQFIGEFN
jgi:UDP-N-acetylmuramate dehydrogenase